MTHHMMRIRPMAAGDVERATSLCAELGYPTSIEQVAARFEALLRLPAQALLVAEDDGVVVGWAHVHQSLTLESGPWAEIAGLVVDHRYRGQGVGKALMAAAEQWARDEGYGEVRLRSNVIRGEAHEFYRRLGYEVVKTQLNFRKALDRRGAGR